MIKIYKIPRYTFGYALCYFQDLGIEEFKIFCLCLLIAHKFHEDFKIKTSVWSKHTKIDSEWLRLKERSILEFFNYHLQLPSKLVVAATLQSTKEFYIQ